MRDSGVQTLEGLSRGHRDWLTFYSGGQTDAQSSREADVNLVRG